MKARLEQLRTTLGVSSDQELADFIGVSRRSVSALKEGVPPTKRMERMISQAEVRAQTAQPAGMQIAQPLVVREIAQPFGNPPTLGKLSADQIHRLEDRMDRVLLECLEIKKEIRRLKP